MFDGAFEDEVAAWKAQGRGRSLDGAGQGPLLVDFTSNDVLGLSKHPSVVSAAVAAIEEHGAGGRASRLLGGGAPTTRTVESQAAAWIGAEDALLFPSGYQANLTLLSSLVGPGDLVFSDALNHASLIDGARLSRAKVHVTRHADPAHLDELLAATTGARRRIVITESVFSMDGDAAPLAELAEVCDRHGAGLIVDEAHAVGVVGPEGRGHWAAQSIDAECLIARLVTGGKALGVGGAFIVGSGALVDMLVHRGRGFVFTTAVAPALVGGLSRAIELAANANDARACLKRNAVRVAAALELAEPIAAIVPFVVGGENEAVRAAEQLAAAGLDVRAVRPPTVPEGTSRLRIVCRSGHTGSQIEALLGHLQQAAPSMRTQGSQARDHLELADPHAASGPESGSPERVQPPLFVVGTDTGIGKTVASACLARALDALYWKPVQTGDDCDTTEVERLAGPLRSGAPRTVAPPSYAFPLPASPHTAAHAADATIRPAQLAFDLAAHTEAAGPARLVVELAGGLLVPLTGCFTQADWLERARPDIVLIARSGLGTLNHTLLTIEALRNRGLVPRALLLVGEEHPANRETLRPFVEHLLELPPLHPLNTASVDAWLQTNDLAGALA